MEIKLLLPSSNTSLPLFISNKFPLAEKTRLFVKPHYSLSMCPVEKSQLLGNDLVFSNGNDSFGNFRTGHRTFGPIRAAVKRRKELPFDNVIERDKKLKLVMKIRKILLNQPDRVMSVRDLGKYRRVLGLQKRRRFIALLRKFPAIFQIMEEGAYSLKFKLTPDAERLYFEELKIKEEMEDLLVVKLRKLLMMSLEKRILVEKITHLKTDLGLPHEFRDTICNRYPQYFRVVPTERGPALELTHWDPELAVSAAELSAEENQVRDLEEKNLIIDRPPRFNTLNLPKGLKLSKGEMRKLMEFRDIPYISPYSDFSGLQMNTKEKEKHACGVVHEILSLTVEKRTLVDHLTHFREEFRFSQQLRGMLIRHPDMFYVSLKGDRDSVFLREAYRDSQLIEKDILLVIKEKLRSLVTVPRLPRRGAPRRDGDGVQENDKEEDGTGGEEEDWSDVDNFMSSDGLEDYDDEDDDDDDDRSDEDDDMPPDFDEDAETLQIGQEKLVKHVENLKQNDERVLEPVFPDGRPRERW